MNPQTQADIELIRSWAPLILEQGEDADPSDLLEIIKIRARLDVAVVGGLYEDPTPFFLVMSADRVCAPHCSTLLYVGREEAERAASEVGGRLNSLSWYGVHAWSMCDALPHWVWQINDSICNELTDTHPAEVVRAFSDLEKFRGRVYINTFFFDRFGQWRRWIDSDDREALARSIGYYRRRTSPT